MRTKEEIAAYARAYYKANKEKVLARVRAYNELNKGQIVEYRRAWASANHDKVLISSRNTARRAVAEINDSYLQRRVGVTSAMFKLLPPELIEAKRLQIQLLRAAKQQGA